MDLWLRFNRLTFPYVEREAGYTAAGWDVVEDYFGHLI